MTMMILDALAGLGLFLFGMHIMEEALKLAAGNQFKKLIRNFTSTTPKALVTGVVSTAMLQSSSVIALMTLSFISAQLITLKSGIGIIFGANIGTTATAWIVALLGFKVSIGAASLLIMGLAALMMLVLSGRPRWAAVMQALVGFGLLFFGLDMMKIAIEELSKGFDLESFKQSWILIYIVVGLLLTAIIQSSSAVTAIALSALSAGAISFEQAAMVAIGSNVGTTVTIVLGALGGSNDKKRLALVHVGFNVITAILAVALFYPIVMLIDWMVGIHEMPIVSLALFHTIFNILGVVTLTPFIHWMHQWVLQWFKSPESTPMKYIHGIDPTITDVAILGTHQESVRLLKNVVKFGLLISNVWPAEVLKTKSDVQTILAKNPEIISFDVQKAYEKNRDIEMGIIAFLNSVTQHQLNENDSKTLDALLHSVEQLAYASKIYKDIYRNMDHIAALEGEWVAQLYTRLRTTAILFFRDLVDGVKGEKELNISAMLRAATQEHDFLIKHITQGFQSHAMDKQSVAIMLNVNQAFYLATNALCNASQMMFPQILDEKVSK